MKYFENRQNATIISNDEMDEIFHCIANYFSHDWLKKPKGYHPLQKLWRRKDALSTNELYFFGTCLSRLSNIDDKWVKKQAVQIKSDQLNNRKGAFFEINALGIISANNQIIKPMKGSNPGFDGILELDKEKLMRISLKHYGDSAHYNEFTKYSEKVEIKLKDILKEKKIISLRILVDAVKGFPLRKDWEDLLNFFPKILSDYKMGEPKMCIICDFWLFAYWDNKDDFQKSHPSFNSYILNISSPYHQNESKNLLDKLDDACVNLVKHSKIENESTINTVFIHLPETASITQCTEWAQNYFDKHPDKPITCIILFQPTIAQDLDNKKTFIHHCFQIIFKGDKFSKWNSNGKTINFNPPVGVCNNIPAKNVLIIEAGGDQQKFDFEGKYFFQKGNLYLEGKKQDDGSIVGNVMNLGSGIFSHSVFQPFPADKSLVLSGHFPPENKLLIL